MNLRHGAESHAKTINLTEVKRLTIKVKSYQRMVAIFELHGEWISCDCPAYFIIILVILPIHLHFSI